MLTETIDRVAPQTIAGFERRIGEEIAVSDWITINQTLIDQFGTVTNDNQWIHTDPSRAKDESPFGTTIAHGFLLLSMLTQLQRDSGSWPKDIVSIVNYGLEKIRFVSPVPVGTRLRNRATLAELERRANGSVFLRLENTLEIEGQDKPAMVAGSLLMLFPEDREHA